MWLSHNNDNKITNKWPFNSFKTYKTILRYRMYVIHINLYVYFMLFFTVIRIIILETIFCA